ncbi:MAG: hypothetical protein GY704_12590, partial [Phycisphaeraceae bacterium]|nr:hypothetical protein [Phycisphaeraceae bacterium]
AELSAGGDVEIALRSRYVTRLLSLGFAPRELDAGEHRLVFECVEEGAIGFDYLWIKTRRLEPFVRTGAVEAEGLPVSPTAPVVEWQTQGMDQSFSGGAHLWVKAVGEGQGIDVTVPVAEPGSYRVKVLLTKSWDYGVLQLSLDGQAVGDPIDTWNPSVVLAPPIDLGAHDLAGEFVLGVRVTGT